VAPPSPRDRLFVTERFLAFCICLFPWNPFSEGILLRPGPVSVARILSEIFFPSSRPGYFFAASSPFMRLGLPARVHIFFLLSDLSEPFFFHSIVALAAPFRLDARRSPPFGRVVLFPSNSFGNFRSILINHFYVASGCSLF